jgi:hypothetical protein
MRGRAILAGALVAVAAAVWVAMPPEPQQLSARGWSAIRGAIHIHTKRSDGSGTVEEVAAAAARAGLQFIVLTDHGDGTRTPLRPAYHSGVLVVDGLEISGDDGHVVALGLPKTPYPLGGEVRDIVEDVRRMGAMAVAAHPGSPKPSLRWTEWTSPFSGLEWLNGDSESRDEGWSIARTLLTYPFSGARSLARMLDRPEEILRRWDELTARRRVVGLPGTDAHARLDVRGNDSGGRLAVLPIPGYEQMFKTFSVTVPGITLTRAADKDAVALLDAIRGGRVYTAIDALATPAAVSFSAVQGDVTWGMGDLVPAADGQIVLRVDSNAPSNSAIVLMKNGQPAETATGRSLRQSVPARPAVYRVEIQVPGAPGKPPIPWVVTNPIYVRDRAESTEGPRKDATETASQYDNGEARGWRTETSPQSKAALNVVRSLMGTELLLRWAIGGTKEESPYAAFAMPAGQSIGTYDRVTFTSRSDRPMRLSVQFRLANGDRWRQSIYLDETARQVSVFFDDVRPADQGRPQRLPLASVTDLLFVVDAVNAFPGTAGQFWIDDVKYGR